MEHTWAIRVKMLNNTTYVGYYNYAVIFNYIFIFAAYFRLHFTINVGTFLCMMYDTEYKYDHTKQAIRSTVNK